MNSMTGFGRGDAAGEGVTWMVEVSSVNRKQLEVVVGLSRELGDLEANIRNAVTAACSRGRLQVLVRCDSAEASGSALKLNEELALQYATALDRLSATLKLPCHG